MQDNWVDFKAVKAAVTIEAVLNRYQVNWLRKKKDELRGRCPIHQGEGTDTFHANLTKNAFNCFSCKARGNVLDFVAAMEKCSVRDAGLKLKDWFSISDDASQKPERSKPAPKGGAGETEKPGNKPLTFQLKGIDTGHPYLATRGISKETAETFGIGFFGGKGSMSGRIVIPIHNESGELVAYAGRAIDESEPRYKLPAGFHKSLELFNLHRAAAAGESNPDSLVVVVEGFFDCLQVTQAGFPCVALMGSSMSEEQEELLVKHFQKAWLMLDGDEAGRNAAAECVTRIGRGIWVRLAEVPDGKQPDQLSSEELQSLLGLL
jgi:DNA primase